MYKKSMVILLYISIYCISCNTESHWGVSKSISDSKNRNTLLYPCRIITPEPNGNQLSKSIKEVFIEKSWFHGKSVDTDQSDYINLAIITTGDNSFFEEYWIGRSYEDHFTFTKKNTLIIRFSKEELADTMKFSAYKRDNETKLMDFYFIKY